jgi:hypothetical protein
VFLYHPYAQLVVNEMERQRRRSAEAPRDAAVRPSRATMARWRFGAGLIALGQRLQGARPLAVATPATSGGGATE